MIRSIIVLFLTAIFAISLVIENYALMIACMAAIEVAAVAGEDED